MLSVHRNNKLSKNSKWDHHTKNIRSVKSAYRLLREMKWQEGYQPVQVYAAFVVWYVEKNKTKLGPNHGKEIPCRNIPKRTKW